ncbi:MAG TPA: histidine phosphatase family protein [Candidatus Dormibacteraeota bacterium]|nr:histidine phosphatase family protein [Candidatus Dormibacteraeota bacterium]
MEPRPGVGADEAAGAVPPYLARYRRRRAGLRSDRPPGPFHLRRSSPDGQVDVGPAEAAGSEVGTEPATGPEPVDLHLVRHGETQSYLADAGLTPRGTWQSRRWGLALSAQVREGETVHLLCAPTARAARTADQVRLGVEDGLSSRGRRARVIGPEPMPELQNFRVWTPLGPMDPTRAAGEYGRRWGRPPSPGERRPLWLLELGRFYRLQEGGGDPIGFWMTSPLLAFEPPAVVVRRLWAGAARLVAEASGRTRFVCCTHSGPMRAFAAWALGHDAGEPLNTEEVRVRIWPDLGRSMVTYRGRTQEIDALPARDEPDWWTLRTVATPPSRASAVGAGSRRRARKDG